ncbi:carcinoembryonic antigen-related cell adhesion molecule 5-like [Centropristis striata]|uniref:carcinoembryonic antigen-related cell adhesion molecule 5-like n=1 Tax=Centropristis striata TaxID=184440 RepID=UPI0027E1DB20|nr:carcinoembryonic antigen-related cell adhesion molecule 5-like [Centropristis striata]
MELLPLLCLVCVAFTGLTKGAGVLPDGPLNAAVGGTVMFTTTLTPHEHTIVTVSWIYGGIKPVFTFTGDNITEPEYEGRITFFMSTGSLELRNLTLSDSGVYSVSIILAGQPPQLGNTRLDVYDPVTVPVVTASSTDMMEFNSSVRLSCSSSGSSLSFLWLNSSSEVTESDRVQLTDGGTNLTITNVTRYDQGPFRCKVSNPVSSNTSEPINLSISYGPENINLTKSPPQEYYAEGSDINMTCSADSRPAAQFQWFLNGELQSDTGSELRLINIQMSQNESIYSCQAFNNKTLRYETSQPAVVSVLVLVTNVVVTSNPTDLLEFNSSVRLSCSSSGRFLSFLWLNSSSEVTESDRVQLTDGGANLTVINVTRYDQGPFTCKVSNPVSEDTSEPINLSISYGPENINLTISATQEYYAEGSDITLTCSADSRPAAQFQWFLNGEMQSDTGPELSLINIQMSQSGNYSCQAFNSKTLRSLMSQPSVVSVLERISGALIKPSTILAIEGNSFNLTCEALGSVFTREWKKRDSDLILTEDMTLHDNNRVLSFSSLNKKHREIYDCIVSNPLGNDKATFILDVKYGPNNVTITGLHEIQFKGPLKLECSADSVPRATYIWKLNGTEIDTSYVFTKDNAEFNDSGSYICEATNAITERTSSSAVHELSVTENPPVGGGGLSNGGIAGIVIAVLVVCAAAGGGGFYFYKKKQTGNPFTSSSRTGGEGRENNAYASQDVNYADITIFQNKDGGTVQMGPQNNSEYAEVKVNNPSSPPDYEAHLERKKNPAPQPSANDVYAQVRKN